MADEPVTQEEGEPIGPPQPKPIPCFTPEQIEAIGEAVRIAGYDTAGDNADKFWVHIRRGEKQD